MIRRRSTLESMIMGKAEVVDIVPGVGSGSGFVLYRCPLTSEAWTLAISLFVSVGPCCVCG